MYILYDLLFAILGAIPGWKTGADSKTFDSLDDLLAFWFRWIGTGFDQLNITGKDTWTFYKPVHNFVRGKDGPEVVDYIKNVYLRRFMVCDQYGRSLNLVEMGLKPKPLPAKYGYWWGFSGSKSHWHRLHAPKGSHRILALSCPVQCELPDGTVIIEPEMRVKAKITSNDVWDYIDDKAGTRYSKSWKDQSRAGRQCLKKDKASKRRNKAKNRIGNNGLWASLAADGFPVDSRLLDENYKTA